MGDVIVPFGKYKGQPVEAMAQDKQYVDWLTAQPWFKEKFGNIYTVIINNFQEPSETPTHNALQAKFLNKDLCLALVKFLNPRYFGDASTLRVQFEHSGFDVFILGGKEISEHEYCYASFHLELKPTIGDDYPAILRRMKAAWFSGQPSRNDVARRDYVSNMVLVLEEYTGAGATCEQFIEIFEASGIRVVFLDEIGS